MTTWRTRAGNGNILDRIGDTPLLRLTRIAGARDGVPEGVEVHVKAEHLNPSGSVKDRAALAMTIEGLRSGALAPGKTILDASSGNTCAWGARRRAQIKAALAPAMARVARAGGPTGKTGRSAGGQASARERVTP